MSTSQSGRRSAAVLLSILAAALLLRCYGLDHGLPDVVGVDEGFEIHRALRLGAGEFDFDRNGKGGFFYLLFLEYGAYFAGLLALGKVGGPTDFARAFATDLTPFWLIARATHALVGVLTVYWAFRLGRLCYGPRVGLVGAAATAVSLLSVSRSHFVGVDVPMTLLVLMVLERAVRWADPERPSRPVLLGLLFGGAVMTKIVAVVMVVPIALANAWRHRDGSWRKRLLARPVLLAYVVAAVFFMLGNPGFVVNLAEFVGEAVAIVFGVGDDFQSPVAEAESRAPNLWLYYGRIVARDMGFPLFALAAAGAVLAALKRRRSDTILLATILTFYLLLAGSRTSHLFYPRYVLPLLPLLAILGGRLLRDGLELLGWTRARTATALGILTVLLVGPSAVNSWKWAAERALEDTRVASRTWFESHAQPDAAVFMVGNPVIYTAPNLSLPLRNRDANVDRLIAELRETEPSKAEMLRWRKEAASAPAFDLRTVRHFEPNGSLDDYLAAGIRYFVLDALHFGESRLARDRKHDDAVLASRADLARACRTDPRVTLVYRAADDLPGLTGPTIEVYEARESTG